MIKHFYSDINGTRVDGPSASVPCEQTIKQARTLGRVAVGDADVIYRNEGASGEYIVVIQQVANGIGGNTYRDMYEIV